MCGKTPALRGYKVGDHVLLSHSKFQLCPGKIEKEWSGPYTVSRIGHHGAVKIKDGEGAIHKVRGDRVRKYYGELDPEDEICAIWAQTTAN